MPPLSSSPPGAGFFGGAGVPMCSLTPSMIGSEMGLGVTGAAGKLDARSWDMIAVVADAAGFEL